MAGDNKTLGRFELVGIPPAPRGVPQVEVTFDIDGNGIVHVSAKDLGTGKEQSIKITASSGLSKDEIDRMVKDAESHAEEDKKKKEVVESRNRLDTLVYSVEKSMSELSDKLSSEDKNAIGAALERSKKALEGTDVAEINAAAEELTKTSHKMSEEMYKKAAEANAASAGGASSSDDNGSADQSSDGKSDDVVDADFEEVR